MEIEIVNKSSNPLPKYQTEGSSGLDLYADLEKDLSIPFGEPKAVPTGIYISIPKGYEAQIRSRSGLALKEGVFCLNSPGTIDSDYRGEIKVILANVKKEDFVVKKGMRIAQMVFSKIESVSLSPVSTLSETSRSSGGFGHTGV